MRRTRRRAALVLAAILMEMLAAGPGSSEPAGTFDFYLLEQTWLPEFCIGTLARTPTAMPHPECRDLETRFGATHPTVHGLWPQNGDGSYPTTCDGSPGCRGGDACSLDGRAIDDGLARELADKWMPGYPHLARHEWREHGTCTGLDQRTYFTSLTGLAAQVPARAIPAEAIGRDVGLADLRTWWGEPRAAFRCERRNGRQFLAAVRTCWTRAADRTPGPRIPCPPNVRDTCRSDRSIAVTRATTVGAAGRAAARRAPEARACRSPGQGPSCARDPDCTDAGWLRCAASGCCTNVPK